ncbi:hypothetical protein NDU88_001215 [Pleurodeles waltl]|uniref:Uncharacterized protein n=1 Tax=Pleurodeles waltl TaxID=8319 RepID=A0AAV7P386_PLEWA|nr:hypothetical protein NDU88_001215 [Pleurodeles waltl]
MACVNIRKCEVDGGDIQSGTVLSLKSGEGDGSKRPMCEVLVEGKKLVLMADSGSPWTIIVQDYFERMFEGIWDMTDLNESDIVAESFEGTTIDVMGFVETEIVFKERRANIKLYVAAKGVNVLGWKDQGKLNIILNPRSKEQVLAVGSGENKEWIIDKFPQVFAKELGYMTDEFGSIKEEVWKDCEKNDDVIQEVKGYVRDGWPVKCKVAAELEPFAKGGKCVIIWDTERCNGMEGSWNVGGRLVTALWLGFPKKEEGFLLYPD